MRLTLGDRRIIAYCAVILGAFLIAGLLVCVRAWRNDRAVNVGVECITGDSTAAVRPEWPDVYTEVHDLIFELRLDHPDIVMAQSIEESGHFRSTLFTQGNNCLGMKVPYTRPTTAVGTLEGHARYASVRDCILDYALWQSSFARGLSRDEYFALLDSTYAAKEGYSDRLRRIIHDNSL